MIGLIVLSLFLGGLPGAEAAPPERYPTHTLSTDQGTVAWWDLPGEGEDLTPVVFVHGLPTSKELWAEVLPGLPGRRRVAVDLLDFGESSALDPVHLDHEDRARGVEAVRAHLGLERIVLVAHDLGASVAIDYMDLFGERVERLVLMSSPVYPDYQEPAVVDLVRRRWIGMPLLRLLPRTLYRKTLQKGLVSDEKIDGQDLEAFERDYGSGPGKRRLWQNLSWGTPEVFFADYPEIMRGIAVPTLVVHGAQDPFVPTEHAHRMDADIPGSRLVILPDGGHFLPIDRPREIADLLRAFLAEEDAESR